MSRTFGQLAATLEGVYRMIGGGDLEGVPLDLSAGAVARSFLWPLMALPLVLASWGPLIGSSAQIDPQTLAAATSASALWAIGLGHLLYTVAFPALLAVFVTRLGGGEGFGAFLIVFNGMRFWLAVVYGVIALMALVGLPSVGVFMIWTAVTGLSLFTIWRLARETLTGEIGFSFAVTLLALGCNAGGDYVAAVLVDVLS